MKKTFLLYTLANLLIIVIPYYSYSQAVGISGNGGTPDPSALLDIDASGMNPKKGLLMPRLTTTERDAIASGCSCTPAAGLLIFNITTNCFEAYVNGAWNTVSCPATCTPPLAPTANSESSLSSTSFIANWNAAPGATSYYLDVAYNSGFSSFVIGYNNINVTNVVTYSVIGLTCNTAYYYRLRASNICGTSANSNTVSLTSSSCCTPPSITSNPLVSTICAGANTSFSVSATGTTLTYQWQLSTNGGGTWNNQGNVGVYTNMTTSTMNITNATVGMNTYQYRCVVSGACAPTATSTAATLTVNSIPSITGSTPSGICGTGTVTLGATASAGTINWYSALSGGSSLASGTSYTTPSISVTTTYYVDATANGCTTGARTSIVATVNTIPGTPSCSTPSAVCPGASATITGAGSSGASTYTYWTASSAGTQYTTGNPTGYTVSGGNLTTPTTLTTGTYTYYVQGETGSCSSSARQSVTVTVAETAPSGLSLSHSSRSKNFTISYTAGVCWGNVNVQYQNSSSTWVTIVTINGNTNQTNYSVSLPADGWYGASWSSVPVRLQRVSNTSQTNTFPQSCTCAAVGGSASSTPSIDEDCNNVWDNSTNTPVSEGLEYPSGHYGAVGAAGASVTCPSAASLGYTDGDYLQSVPDGGTVVLNFYSLANCTGTVNLTYTSYSGSSIWVGYVNSAFNPATGSTIALPSDQPAMGSYSLPLGGACTNGNYSGQCSCNSMQRTGENGNIRYHCRYSRTTNVYTYY